MIHRGLGRALLLTIGGLVGDAAIGRAQPVASPSPAPRLMLLRPARVFDGVSGQAQAGVVVLVRGDQITAIGTPAQVNAPKEAEIIEAGVDRCPLARAAPPLQRGGAE